MNTTKKITVVLAVMVVAAMAAPAVMGDNVEYSATVVTGQNTAICATPSPNGAFGALMAGSNGSITPSFALQNTGDWNATVAAAFENNGTGAAAGTYGLVGTSTINVIGGDNFALEAVDLSGTTTSLTNDGNDTVIRPDLPHGVGCKNYDAHLDVPNAAPPDTYTGNVTLAFGNAEA